MLGLIKKDFLLIKANLKSMIIIFVIYIMLAFQGQGTQAIPEIIQGKDTLAVLANILILNRNERTAQLHGVGHVVAQKLV